MPSHGPKVNPHKTKLPGKKKKKKNRRDVKSLLEELAKMGTLKKK